MGHIEFFFRCAAILFVISVFVLFIVDRGTMEFKVTVLSAVISFLVSAVSMWMIIRDKKNS